MISVLHACLLTKHVFLVQLTLSSWCPSKHMCYLFAVHIAFLFVLWNCSHEHATFLLINLKSLRMKNSVPLNCKKAQIYIDMPSRFTVQIQQ